MPKRQHSRSLVDWRDGLTLLVEIVTPKSVATMSLPLAQSHPGEGFNIVTGLCWPQLGCVDHVEAMNVLMEAGGFDQCSFGACHLRRASDEKTCRLTYPLGNMKPCSEMLLAVTVY